MSYRVNNRIIKDRQTFVARESLTSVQAVVMGKEAVGIAAATIVCEHYTVFWRVVIVVSRQRIATPADLNR